MSMSKVSIFWLDFNILPIRMSGKKSTDLKAKTLTKWKNKVGLPDILFWGREVMLEN